MQGFGMGRYTAPSTLDPALSAQPTKKRRLNTTATSPAAPPTVRFEMPFAIWCSTCPTYSSSQLIGQGVRFNAHKTRIGNYYSTPIWQFRMKHTACGGWIEIRTDPQNSEYTVAEGARRRDTGDDLAVASRTGAVVIGGSAGPGEDTERARAREDAFAALEGKKEEKSRAAGEARRLDELRSLKERDWRDADRANKRVRDAFRVGRRRRERDAETGAALQERLGLGFEVVGEDEADARRAGFVEFGVADGGGDAAGLEAARKPLFESSRPPSKKGSKAALSQTLALHQELSGNTRAGTDPFSASHGTSALRRSIPGLRRKGSLDKVKSTSTGQADVPLADTLQSTSTAPVSSASGPLVDYGYNSE